MRHLTHAERKRLNDQKRFMRDWNQWHREQLEEALAGPHGDVLAVLMRLLTNLETQKPSTLLEYVRAQNWRHVAYPVRLMRCTKSTPPSGRCANDAAYRPSTTRCRA